MKSATRTRAVALTLAVVVMVVAGAAFAASSAPGKAPLPAAPVLTSKPDDPTPNATNLFAWTTRPGVTFQCSLENGKWDACTTPYTWRLETTNYGQHQFAVRSIDVAGNPSESASYRFKYEKGLPKAGVPFQISGGVAGLVIGVEHQVDLTVTNPNSVPIFVSALHVEVAADSTPTECPSATNFEATDPKFPAGQLLKVPAGGDVTLPDQGVTAPQMLLLNRPVNQDACKGTSFALTFTGTATN